MTDDVVMQLIELAEDLDDLEDAVASLEIDDAEILSEVPSDLSDIVLDLAQAIEERAEGASDYRLDDDRVLTDGGTSSSGSERIAPLNLTEGEAAYLWEMMKREVGKKEVQYSDDRETVESLHTKVRRIYRERDTDNDRAEGRP
jgi:hypothetical protein